MVTNYTDPASIHERHESWEAARRDRAVFGILMLLVIVALAGAAWYFYPRFQRHETALARITGLPQAVDTLNGQMNEARERFADWSRSQEDVRQQVDKFGREMRSR